MGCRACNVWHKMGVTCRACHNECAGEPVRPQKGYLEKNGNGAPDMPPPAGGDKPGTGVPPGPGTLTSPKPPGPTWPVPTDAPADGGMGARAMVQATAPGYGGHCQIVHFAEMCLYPGLALDPVWQNCVGIQFVPPCTVNRFLPARGWSNIVLAANFIVVGADAFLIIQAPVDNVGAPPTAINVDIAACIQLRNLEFPLDPIPAQVDLYGSAWKVNPGGSVSLHPHGFDTTLPTNLETLTGRCNCDELKAVKPARGVWVLRIPAADVPTNPVTLFGDVCWLVDDTLVTLSCTPCQPVEDCDTLDWSQRIGVDPLTTATAIQLGVRVF